MSKRVSAIGLGIGLHGGWDSPRPKPIYDLRYEHLHRLPNDDAELKKMDNKTKNQKPIRSFLDLKVYQNTYQASITVLTKIVPKLPKQEQYNLADQLRRSWEAIPRLIAEGYAKKHQPKGFRKYLDDALAESNEMIVSISHCRDVYNEYVDVKLCDQLIDTYDKSSRQIYNLAKAWQEFHTRTK